MIWTIMPEKMVINENSDFPHLQEITYGQRKLLCYPVSPGKMCIFRVLSSNPADYLNSHLQPGSIINVSQEYLK